MNNLNVKARKRTKAQNWQKEGNNKINKQNRDKKRIEKINETKSCFFKNIF